MYVQQHVRLVDAYGRALAKVLAEIVHNGIFHFIRDEFGVAELFAEHDGVYGKCLIDVQNVFPADGFDLFVNLIGVFGGEVLDGFQDADSCAQTEVCLVHHLFVAAEGDHASAYLYVIGS